MEEWAWKVLHSERRCGESSIVKFVEWKSGFGECCIDL